ncbi:MAG: hypothetical protein OXG37_11625 [Actinomycetia bacterium]|nr:hypothetical protein [Actinomycetes bacterium]
MGAQTTAQRIRAPRHALRLAPDGCFQRKHSGIHLSVPLVQGLHRKIMLTH